MGIRRYPADRHLSLKDGKVTVRKLLARSYLLSTVAASLRRVNARRSLHKLIKANKLEFYGGGDATIQEIRARHLFEIAARSTGWCPSSIYPIGGASGALLSYILLRVLEEFPFTNALELGAGHSTRMLDAWSKEKGTFACTLEHDEAWASRMSSLCVSENSRILYRPLEDVHLEGRHCRWYSKAKAELDGKKHDLLIVDGPVGTKRFSRIGVSSIIPEVLSTDWLIIWDDIDRPGDLESFALVIRLLRERGIEHNNLILEGDGRVGLIFTDKFSGVRHLW